MGEKAEAAPRGAVRAAASPTAGSPAGERAPAADSAATRTAPKAARAALVLLWIALAAAIALRRIGPAEELRLPDRPLPPVTIDLNRDPWPRLLLIEGIGESLARRIVAAREERGGFTDLAEVKALPGVPDDAIERARPWLRLGPAPIPAGER